jgi:hypothetical protein
MAGVYMERETAAIITGVVFGLICRLQMLRTDYRQYPTYPHGRIIHIALGFIAAGLGAVAVPALISKQYTAVTFLALAAQQFRDVRSMEREMLTKIDRLELVPRGSTYIEGIAMVFEGRNYMVIFSALAASLSAVWLSVYAGIAAGIAALCVSAYFKSGQTLGKVADIKEAPVRFEGPNLFVDGILIMNVGLSDTRDRIARHGLGFVLSPKNRNCRASLANLGQRQAILHEVSNVLGVYRDSGEPSLLPLSKLDLEDGRLAVFLLPQLKDSQKAAVALKRVPLLENALRMPSESKALNSGDRHA